MSKYLRLSGKQQKILGSEYISSKSTLTPNLCRAVRQRWNLRQKVILLPYVELIRLQSLRILDVLNELTAEGNKRCV